MMYVGTYTVICAFQCWHLYNFNVFFFLALSSWSTPEKDVDLTTKERLPFDPCTYLRFLLDFSNLLDYVLTQFNEWNNPATNYVSCKAQKKTVQPAASTILFMQLSFNMVSKSK